MKSRGYFLGFIALSLLYLFLTLISGESLLPWIKPFLIPSLLLWLLMEKIYSKALMSALFFSFLGDVLLIFDQPSYFIAGLLAFLITQLLYSYIFSRNIKLSFRNVGLFLPFLASYMTLLLFFIWNNLGAFKLPIILYSLIISMMLLIALARFRINKNPANAQIAFGALLFVISDSFLAYKMFQSGFSADNFWVMITYLSAQFFIANGIRVSDQLKTFSPRHN